MKSDEVSRRFVVGALGVGAATAAAGVAIGTVRRTADQPAAQRNAPGATPAPDNVEAADPALVTAQKLVAPLAAGGHLDRWTVERVLPVKDGAASLVLSDASGTQFQLDICARDLSGSLPAGPGHAERFEILLANSGDGSKDTYEDHGLAAMALAEVIRANEHRVDHSLFQTQARRVAENKARVYIT